MHSKTKKIIFAVTSPASLKFLENQIRRLVESGWDTAIISSPDDKNTLKKFAESEKSVAIPVAIQREIAFSKDLRSLWQLYASFRTHRPSIINVGTPKAGLLGGLAGVAARTPVRIYTLHGLRSETARGPKRSILHLMEKLACACAHKVVCVSPSLRNRAIELNILPESKAVVLEKGTCNGIDTNHFSVNRYSETEISRLRDALGLPEGTPTIGFVGRFVRDKGINELVDAFNYLFTENPTLRLLMVGRYEEGDPIDYKIRDVIDNHPGIIKAGHVPDTGPYYKLMDVLALPTYREGYPGVVLEAAAMGKPVVASNATGAIDAVINEVTGITIQVGDFKSLASGLQRVLENKAFAHNLGKNGQERVLRDFQPETMHQALEKLYQDLLSEAYSKRRETLKRNIDILLSATGLIFLSMPMLVLALAIRFKLGTPIIFKQQRPGLHGEPFTMYKFRTMLNTLDQEGNLLPANERITSFGRFLRSTSLDELPELINVLRGDMSLVGPRPLLMEYLDLYTREQNRRHEVRPGITGWAQVNGRNALSWEEKFNLDLWYVDNHNFYIDVKIIAMTLLKVIRRDGINNSTETTMPRFYGNRESL